MIKSRSKSKIKQTTPFMKKQIEDKLEKNKKVSKQLIKRIQEKQNNTLAKLSMTSAHSKKKAKNLGQDLSKPVSPLCFSKKKNQSAKNEDQNFIQKLFSQTQQTKYKTNKNFMLQQLIQNLLPQQRKSLTQKTQTASQNGQSPDLVKQLHLKHQQVTSLKQQIQQLKLYISKFIFKVFDMSVLCRKHSHKISDEDQNLQFNRKTDQVISYLDSIIRHWKLQQKIKIHCQSYGKRMNTSLRKLDDNKKRCHTQSLKIPLQDYLQSLQNTEKQRDLEFELKKYKQNTQNEETEQIMKILSRRSSGIARQQQEIYIAIKKYQPKNDNELAINTGERITILQKKFNDRWLGIKQGKIGYFPKSCLFQY